ncbi:MAG: GTPase HflX [Verrucomicrobiota bacterium]|jgi:GTP-binding protein HflX|nr:GTPase HflX [Verrucomicrobiota bacterium]MDD8051406.1 GTPase HflX [Verrucomicrobiota bacterium]MDI9385902.1 GTPase HflX [Verrucomicrobiota bacterium]
MKETVEQVVERALVVGLLLPRDDRWEAEESLRELERLASTAGAQVVDRILLGRDKISPGTFMGSGQAEELGARCRAEEITLLLIDHELSPVQGRNLERLLEGRVLDRTEVILDIFSQRARTREGMLQIELAQLEYLLPRLTRMWTHLSRQKGGIGLRGPGETQLEVDRRKIQDRIIRLNKELADVRRSRTVQRSGRRRLQSPIVALVGYTNAGKSTLLNRLTGSDVNAEDKLFATLDPTTRMLKLPGYERVLLTDTVGFLRRLPHGLIEAFRATLEEVVEADILVHVIDASHPEMDAQVTAVEAVLEELGAADKPTIHVLNKIDCVDEPATMDAVRRRFSHGVLISARTGEGLAQLEELLQVVLGQERVPMMLRLPPDRSDLIAKIHRHGTVVSKSFLDSDVIMEVRVSRELVPELEAFIQR